MKTNIRLSAAAGVFMKRFSSHTESWGLFNLKLSENDQSIMVFLSNYERSNFLFSIQ